MFDSKDIKKDVVYLALYDNQEPFDVLAKLIKLGTNSDFSHCELIFNGYSYSSSLADNGVRSKPISEVYVHPENWLIIPLYWADGSKIIEFFENTEGQKYSWVGVIVCQIFNFRIKVPGYFCSEWVIAALAESLGVEMNSQLYSPEDARTFCLSGNIIYNLRNLINI
jgi:hypothetical protein